MNSPNVHVILQGKGGVGKSAIAAFLAQWLEQTRTISADSAPVGQNDSQRVLCVDTDPVNATFAGYAALNVHRVDILRDDEIDPRRFDDIMNLIVAEPRDVVIDNGASSFVPLAHYLLANEIPTLLHELGRTLVLHVVITGGAAILDTLSGFDSLASHFREPTQFVVWLNPFFGPIQLAGKSFEELNVYRMHCDRISAVIPLPVLHPDTFGADLSSLLSTRKTFDEAIADTENYQLMQRHRLRIIREQVWDSLNSAAAAGLLGLAPLQLSDSRRPALPPTTSTKERTAHEHDATLED